ncbi:MAG: right-handed parallel beta-helix repeat-containing protein, partial [Promethearchaeota archaeon]
AGICTGSGTPVDPYVIENYEIDGGGTTTCIDVLNSDAHFIIQNCTLFNSGIGTNPFYHAGIRFYNVSNAKLFHNIIYNHSRTGIRLYYECDNNNITNNYVNNSYCGIYLRDGCRDNTILNNTSSNNTRWGIQFYINSDHNLVEGNFLISNTEDGIQLNDGCDNNTIFNNTLNGNNLNGIKFITSCNQNEIINNKVLNNLGTGIEIQSSCDTNLIYNNLISINTVQAQDSGTNNQWDNGTIGNYWSDYGGVDSNDDGIGDTPYLVGGSTGSQDNYPIWNDGFNGNPILIDDTGAQNWAWARSKIWCSGSGKYSDPYLIENLVIDGEGTSTCIDILNSNDYLTIQNVTCYNSGGGSAPFYNTGIRFYNVSNAILIKNNCTNNQWGGIRLYYECDNNSIIDNFIDNSYNGIYLRDGCNNNSVSKNICIDNSQEGIELYDNCDYNNLTSNNVYSNDRTGIRINLGCDYNFLYNNTLEENSQEGIRFVSDCVGNTIYQNNLSNNLGIGIQIDTNTNDTLIYLNDFTNNTIQAHDSGTNNQWDNGMIGNYWSDYGGLDSNDDGIGDMPYNNITGTALSQDNYPIWEDGDDLPPYINIISPTTSEVFGLLAPGFQVEIVDPNLDIMWYTIDGGVNNVIFATNQTIDQNNWTAQSDGAIIITFYANDTSGNINFDEVIVIKDTFSPIINIISPTSSETFGISAPDFIVEINDPNLDFMWYTIDGGLNNITFVTPVTLIFYANDTLGHLNSSQVVINKLTPILIIDIISPTSDQLFDSDAPDFIIEVGGGSVDVMWYTIDNGLNNFTFTANETINQAAWISMPDGVVTIKFYVNNTLGTIFSNEISVNKDVEAPIISIIEPSTNDVFEIAPVYELTITELNLDTIWYTLDDGENNFTVSGLTGIVNQERWESLPNGYVTIRFYVNDTLGHLSFDEVIIVKDVPTPTGSTGIPGYNILIIIGTISLMALITSKYKYSRKLE